MSRVEIVTKNGKKLGEIDDLAGTIETTEEWETILKSRRPKLAEKEEDEDDERSGQEEGRQDGRKKGRRQGQ